MCVCNVEARSWHQASSSITLYLAIYLLIFFLSSRCIGTLYRPCCPQTHSDPLASAGINGVCQYTWCYCIFWGRSSLNLELTNSARLVGHWAPGIPPPPVLGLQAVEFNSSHLHRSTLLPGPSLQSRTMLIKAATGSKTVVPWLC